MLKKDCNALSFASASKPSLTLRTLSVGGCRWSNAILLAASIEHLLGLVVAGDLPECHSCHSQPQTGTEHSTVEASSGKLRNGKRIEARHGERAEVLQETCEWYIWPATATISSNCRTQNSKHPTDRCIEYRREEGRKGREDVKTKVESPSPHHVFPLITIPGRSMAHCAKAAAGNFQNAAAYEITL